MAEKVVAIEDLASRSPEPLIAVLLRAATDSGSVMLEFMRDGDPDGVVRGAQDTMVAFER